MTTKHQNKIRNQRQVRSRARTKGISGVPRLSVFRSNRHITAQLIDDAKGKTIASAFSYGENKSQQKKSVTAMQVGESIAKKAKELGIKRAIFDRGSYKFHGRVKAVCEGAIKGGLKI